MIWNLNTTRKHGHNIMIGYPTLDHKYRFFTCKKIIWHYMLGIEEKNWK